MQIFFTKLKRKWKDFKWKNPGVFNEKASCMIERKVEVGVPQVL